MVSIKCVNMFIPNTFVPIEVLLYGFWSYGN